MGYDELGGPCDTLDTLGGRLALAREALGMSISELAAQLAIPAPSLQYWEGDRAAPSLHHLMRIAALVDVSLSWLATGQGHGPNWDDLTDLPSPSPGRPTPMAQPRLSGSTSSPIRRGSSGYGAA